MAKERLEYTFGSYRLDANDRLLYKEGDLIALPPKVMDTLLLLVANAGHVVGKEHLLKELWPDTFVEDGTLTQYVSLLRKALGENGRWIENLPRRGYRFTEPVEERRETENQERAAAEQPRPKRRLRALLLSVLAAGVVFAVARVAWNYLSAPAPIQSVAVLPFLNLSGNSNLDYITDGLTDELTHAMTKLDGIRVAARTSAFQYRGKSEDVRTIGERLNVTGVLEGSVRLDENKIRVTAQLIDARTGYHVWSETYDGSLDDLLSIQERIGSAAAARLGGRAAVPASPAPDLTSDAYLLYLRGRYFLAKGRPETFRQAVDSFQEVIARKPAYARAHSGLADSYYRWALWESLPPAEAFGKARRAAEQALALDETLAEAHASLANVKFQHDWDYAGAEREFRRSIELNAHRADTWHWFSHMLTAVGRFEESEQAIRKAIEAEPFDLPSLNHLGWCHYFAGEYDKAIEQHRRVLELDPVHGQTRLLLGRALLQRRRYGEALDQLRRNLELSPDSPERLAALAQAYAAAGAREEAMKILDRLQALGRERYVAAYSIAIVYAGLGRRVEALSYLGKAAEERSTRLVELKYEPVFEFLRGDPAYRKVLQTIGL
jgi:TolB-like protein/Tfp pilus assembly protein PilF